MNFFFLFYFFFLGGGGVGEVDGRTDEHPLTNLPLQLFLKGGLTDEQAQTSLPLPLQLLRSWGHNNVKMYKLWP